jgi:hypothetical protein
MKIRDTLDKILENAADARVIVIEIRRDLAEVRKDLKYHIKRTDVVEDRLDKHLARVEPILGFFKVFGILLVSGAAAAAIFKLFLL